MKTISKNFAERRAVMSQQLEEKTSFDGSKVQVLGETYEEGKPEKPENWREKLKTREDMMAYLKTGVR
jgi:hypothetical protein